MLAALRHQDQAARAAGEGGVADPELVLPVQDVQDLGEVLVHVRRVLGDRGVVEHERAEPAA